MPDRMPDRMQGKMPGKNGYIIFTGIFFPSPGFFFPAEFLQTGVPRQASKQGREPASKQGREPASQRASKQASKQAREQAREPASKQSFFEHCQQGTARARFFRFVGLSENRRSRICLNLRVNPHIGSIQKRVLWVSPIFRHTHMPM